MSETETRYAQIEKEAVAITWAFEKFSTYILGKHISIEINHKSLVPLSIQRIPGKLLYTADALSRAPMREKGIDSQILEKQSEVESFIATVTTHLPPISSTVWLEIMTGIKFDEIASKLHFINMTDLNLTK